MANGDSRPAARIGVVLRTERVTPNLVRVVLGGDDLSDLAVGPYTDSYVKLQFPRDGVVYPKPFDTRVIRDTMPREQWPVTRTYTIRRWIPDGPQLWLDFVVHGDAGLASQWAARARPGDTIHFGGPGGAYAPDMDADWHLLAGDESALPAIAAAVEAMPSDALAKVFVEVSDAAEEQVLDGPAKCEITWLHRGSRPVGTALIPAVRELEFPPGRVHAFVHGEATFVKELRRNLRLERGLPMDQLSISGYWRQGMDEDGWQSSKRLWVRQVESEEGAAAAAGGS
jgi:NADPH-dependent ferric siderophore reductase